MSYHLVSLVHAAGTVNPILLNSVTLTIQVDRYTLWNNMLCNSLPSPRIICLIGLCKVFGPKDNWEQEAEDVHNKELNAVCSSLNISTKNRSAGIRWMGQVMCMGEKKISYKDRLENVKERGYLDSYR